MYFTAKVVILTIVLNDYGEVYKHNEEFLIAIWTRIMLITYVVDVQVSKDPLPSCTFAYICDAIVN